jgi:ketosteroid isomerase-like protein
MTPIEVVRRLTERMSALDAAGALECFDDDARAEIMLLPGFADPNFQDYGDIARAMKWGIRQFVRWNIQITEVWETTDPEVVITEWVSEGELNDGHVYRNRYAHIFRVVDDRITFWREYGHPEPLEVFLGHPTRGRA